jgi:branched-chain amino acid transport system ATP-binding protein
MTATPLLAVEEATRRFNGLVAVDHVSFTLQRGEIGSIIGPNGAGKTTLFNLITGQLRQTSGRILFRAERIDTVPPHGRAQRGMARTFQIPKPLISLSVQENALVGAFLKHSLFKEAYRKATSVLDEVGLAARAHVLAGQLTLSERRRLELARALALEPELILLDEVMAGLDPIEIDQVIGLIKRLNSRGITFLIVEHNLRVVRSFSSRVIVLDRGAKLADGPTETVLRDGDVVRAYLGKRCK